MYEIDHTEYPKIIAKKESSVLRWIIEDCREALRVNPNGPKAGFYQDEINYCSMELAKRNEN